MQKIIKYAFTVRSHFHIENFLSHNNQSNDSYFWLEEHDSGGRYFYFSSTLLNDPVSLDSMLSIGSQIVSIYEGIYTLLDRNRHASTYFDLIELRVIDTNLLLANDFTREVHKIDIDFSKVSESEQNRPINEIYILFEKIIKDEFLTNMFFLLSKKVDYKMLYMIYDEIIRYLRKAKKLKFLSDYNDGLKLFRDTANSYEAIGSLSRHGRTKDTPAIDPMNIEDARNLIFDIVEKLLQVKFDIQLPTYWGLSYLDLTDIDLTTFFKK